MPLIHPFTHTFTHQRRLAAMQGTNQLVRSNWGLGVLLRDTWTRPGWDRTGNPPTARKQLISPHAPKIVFLKKCTDKCAAGRDKIVFLQGFDSGGQSHSTAVCNGQSGQITHNPFWFGFYFFNLQVAKVRTLRHSCCKPLLIQT